jgi:dihydrodipicolinate synthase/N-acetylneuraminate lyase
LSDDERKRWIDIVVGETAGQVPVVAATTSGHALPAVELSRYAQRVGADGIMAMPPHVLHPDPAGCYAYYEALARALEIPICIQNYIGPVGTPMSAELLARMCRELPHVVRFVAPRQQPTMDCRVEGLDPSIEHFRHVRHIRDGRNGKSRAF